jgi:hypothetical protein
VLPLHNVLTAARTYAHTASRSPPPPSGPARCPRRSAVPAPKRATRCRAVQRPVRCRRAAATGAPCRRCAGTQQILHMPSHTSATTARARPAGETDDGGHKAAGQWFGWCPTCASEMRALTSTLSTSSLFAAGTPGHPAALCCPAATAVPAAAAMTQPRRRCLSSSSPSHQSSAQQQQQQPRAAAAVPSSSRRQAAADARAQSSSSSSRQMRLR